MTKECIHHLRRSRFLGALRLCTIVLLYESSSLQTVQSWTPTQTWDTISVTVRSTSISSLDRCRKFSASSVGAVANNIFTTVHTPSFAITRNTIQCRDLQCRPRRAMLQESMQRLGVVVLLLMDLPVSAQASSTATTKEEALPATTRLTDSDLRKLFQQGRVLESQGNLAAALRIYEKVVAVDPRFVYGWSSIGNVQTAFGSLDAADASYTTAIQLCQDLPSSSVLSSSSCQDLSVILLNRGCLRLNHGLPKQALDDLQRSQALRNNYNMNLFSSDSDDDAILLQNLARAQEVNGLYRESDMNYSRAIQLTSNEVTPFWLRSAMVKYQLGSDNSPEQFQAGYDLLKRVQNKFPDAPEVKAAAAVFLYTLKQDPIAAQQIMLQIPDRARLKYSDPTYLSQAIAWPPAMRSTLSKITRAIGDSAS